MSANRPIALTTSSGPLSASRPASHTAVGWLPHARRTGERPHLSAFVDDGLGGGLVDDLPGPGVRQTHVRHLHDRVRRHRREDQRHRGIVRTVVETLGRPLAANTPRPLDPTPPARDHGSMSESSASPLRRWRTGLHPRAAEMRITLPRARAPAAGRGAAAGDGERQPGRRRGPSTCSTTSPRSWAPGRCGSRQRKTTSPTARRPSGNSLRPSLSESRPSPGS